MVLGHARSTAIIDRKNCLPPVSAGSTSQMGDATSFFNKVLQWKRLVVVLLIRPYAGSVSGSPAMSLLGMSPQKVMAVPSALGERNNQTLF